MSAAGTAVGSGCSFASPFVRMYTPSGRSRTSTIRWVYIARSSPARSETTSPARRSFAATGAMMTAEPRPIAGSIDLPPTMIVWRPVSGTTLPRMTPNRTRTIRPMRTASRSRRSVAVLLPRILMASSSSPENGPQAGCDPSRLRFRWSPAPSLGEGRGRVQPTSGLRVVDGLLGVERERRDGRDALQVRVGGERQRDPEAQRLAGRPGQRPVAELRALGVGAERGAVEGRPRGHDDGTGEAGAAAGDGGADFDGQGRPERVR